MVQPHSWTNGGDKVLLLKRINKEDRTTYNGFKYGQVGDMAVAPDWDPTPECGGGLHAWPWGLGLGAGTKFDIINDEWLVLAADPADTVNIENTKCKFRKGKIVYSGDFAGAWAMIVDGRDALIREMAKSGATKDCAASSGDGSTSASSGDGSTSASSGYGSTSASSGCDSKSASSGYNSTSASSGDGSASASAGFGSVSDNIGKGGVAAAIGRNGRAKAGESGCIMLTEWIESERRYVPVTGCVGYDGIKANTWYTAKDRKLVVVEH